MTTDKLESFSKEMIEFNKMHPVDKDYFKTQRMKNMEFNLKTGFISQEEYDRYQEGMYIYAEVVT